MNSQIHASRYGEARRSMAKIGSAWRSVAMQGAARFLVKFERCRIWKRK